MPATESNLSKHELYSGFDMVVAITARSINTTLLNYLDYLHSKKMPPTELYFIDGQDGQPQPTSKDDISTKVNGVDLFSIADGTPVANNTTLRTLLDAKFSAGFRASIGPPSGNVMDVVESYTEPDGPFTINSHLPFSELRVITFNAGNTAWVNRTSIPNSNQPYGATTVLTLHSKDIAALSTSDRALVNNMSASAFSVQQLLFDLTFEPVMAMINLNGGDQRSNDPAFQVLRACFTSDGLVPTQNLRALIALPVVEQTIDTSSLRTTAIGLSASNIDTPVIPAGCNTLSYNCSVDDNRAIMSSSFADSSWNWIDSDQLDQYAGVLAIKRSVFVEYLQAKLGDFVSSQCVIATASVRNDDASHDIDYSWSFEAGGKPVITRPVVTRSPDRGAVLSYHFVSQAASPVLPEGHLAITWNFDMSVEFFGDTIRMSFTTLVWVEVADTDRVTKTNVFNRTVGTDLPISVLEFGNLVVGTVTPTVQGPDPTTNAIAWWKDSTRFNIDWQNHITKSSDIASQMTTVLEIFQLPGSDNLSFSDFTFSDWQDFIVYFGYADIEQDHLDGTLTDDKVARWTTKRITLSGS